MFSMIAELRSDINFIKQQQLRNDEPENALPSASYGKGRPSAVKPERKKQKTHTFAMDPEKGTCGFPLLEDTTLEEPFASPFMASLASYAVVR